MSQVIKIKRKFSTGAPTTSNLAEGEIAINTFDKKLYIRDNANAIVEIGGGGASSGATTEVTQANHGLSLKDCIRHNGSSWIKAQANSGDTLALGVVTAIDGTAGFTVAQSGRFELTGHTLTAGQWYYLSASSAGALTATEPTISQPLVYVESADIIFVFPYRPTNLLVNGGADVIPGDDTVTSAKIVDLTIATGDIANDAITYAKIQNVSATDRILGRDTAGAGDVEEITPANLRTMLGIETGSTADQTGAQIKTAYEAESNAFTDAQFTKLAAIEASATADQTNAEIETAYDAQISVATQGEAEAGSSTSVKRFTPQRISQAIAALASGGLTLVAVKTADFTAEVGKQYSINTTSQAITMTLPVASPSAGDTIGIIDYNGTFDTNNLTIAQANSKKIFRVDASGTVDTKNWSTSIKFIDDTVGWLPAGD